jgi:hypothetical protein
VKPAPPARPQRPAAAHLAHDELLSAGHAAAAGVGLDPQVVVGQAPLPLQHQDVGHHLGVLDKGVDDALHVADAVLHVGRGLDDARKHLLVLRVEVRVRVHLRFVIEGAETAVGVLLVRRRQRRHVQRSGWGGGRVGQKLRMLHGVHLVARAGGVDNHQGGC